MQKIRYIATSIYSPMVELLLTGRKTQVRIEYDKGLGVTVGDVFWCEGTFLHIEYLDIVPENCNSKQSIDMRKEACELFLRVNNIRVEKLQQITASDAIAEGCIDPNPIDAFKNLCDTIYGKYYWAANPEVIVFDIERIERPKCFLKS